jgi:vancomycin resistance protein YoaR
VEGLTVQSTPSQVGRRLDVETTQGLIKSRIASLSLEAVDLVVLEVHPQIEDASQAKAQAEQMISAPLILTFADRQWTLDQATIARMVVFRQETAAEGKVEDAKVAKVRLAPGLDQGKLTAYVKQLVPQVNQVPRDARFDFNPATKTLTPLVLSQEGRTLDVAETARRIAAQVATAQRTVPLAVALEKPRVATEDAAKLGIKELVSQATSFFQGSPAGRVKNIQIATARFNGLVVPPGAVFSFNENLGEVTAAQGYDEQAIILDNRVVQGLGGGICQVSTTAFRAAFLGGFPIVERWAHAFRVFYYEQGGNPVGLDATIFTPNLDFKFQNDTGQYLLIETEVNVKANSVSFRFYGTRPNRVVEMEGPVTENVVKQGPPIYQDDPTLPKGTMKQVDWGVDGLDVTIYRIIKQGQTVLKREKFFSHFRPWQDVFLVGTKQ